MPQTNITLTINLPINSWQCLVAMTAQDLREPENFITWLISREAQERGLLPTDNGAPESVTRPTAEGVADGNAI